MVDSVTTNAAALGATRDVQASTRSLNNTQNEISSGLAVSSAQDDAATFAIAQGLRADNAGLSAASNSLSNALSQVDVALAAGTSASNSLIDLRELAVQASDPSLDDASRASINDAFQAQLSQFSSTLDAAEFSGTNVLNGSGGSISAIINEDGSESVAVDSQNLTLGGPNVSLDASASLDDAASAQAIVGAIDESLNAVNSSLSTLGSAANAFENTLEAITAQSDQNTIGIGNLVDSNLAEASAQLEADEVRQQLGIVALNIANSQPESVLSLFGE